MKPDMEHSEQSTEMVSLLNQARWITREQLRLIEDLIYRKGGRVISRPQTGEEEPYGPTIYAVDDEPLVVFNKVSRRNQRLIAWVFPSEKHARDIQEAGILNFEEPKGQKGAQHA